MSADLSRLRPRASICCESRSCTRPSAETSYRTATGPRRSRQRRFRHGCRRAPTCRAETVPPPLSNAWYRVPLTSWRPSPASESSLDLDRRNNLGGDLDRRLDRRVHVGPEDRDDQREPHLLVAKVAPPIPPAEDREHRDELVSGEPRHLPMPAVALNGSATSK